MPLMRRECPQIKGTDPDEERAASDHSDEEGTASDDERKASNHSDEEGMASDDEDRP